MKVRFASAERSDRIRVGMSSAKKTVYVDVDRAQARDFGLSDELAPGEGSWHAHRRHQLLYAVSGSLWFVTEGTQWFLPPLRAAWIPANTRHRVRVLRPTALRTVYLSGPFPDRLRQTVRVFSVPPLARELILEATRFGPALDPMPELARASFGLLRVMLAEWSFDQPLEGLPVARSPELARAMEWALANLHKPVAIDDAAQVAGISVRTLARRFMQETGTSWRTFVHHARMLRAIEMLADPHARIAQTAYAVGYESLSAFNRAFVAFAGEAPRVYRAKLTPSSRAS
jgi:AraC-like DNA-binding protein